MWENIHVFLINFFYFRAKCSETYVLILCDFLWFIGNFCLLNNMKDSLFWFLLFFLWKNIYYSEWIKPCILRIILICSIIEIRFFTNSLRILNPTLFMMGNFSTMGYRLQIQPWSKGLYSLLGNVVINVTPVVTTLNVYFPGNQFLFIENSMLPQNDSRLVQLMVAEFCFSDKCFQP